VSTRGVAEPLPNEQRDRHYDPMTMVDGAETRQAPTTRTGESVLRGAFVTRPSLWGKCARPIWAAETRVAASIGEAAEEILPAVAPLCS
jgi:hypothetical protein